MAKSTAFSLADYRISEFSYKKPDQDDFQIGLTFIPSGKYDSKKGIFHLQFSFSCYIDNAANEFVKGVVNAEFKFSELLNFDEIPGFFYINAIAIIFPYVRAFISTLTLQANTAAVLVPTLNLTSLETQLRQSTVEMN